MNILFINNMDDIQKIQAIARNFKNPIKLHIIKYLSKNDASNQDIFIELNKTLKINYRSGIFGALKDLQETGLVKKYYDDESNKLKYKLIVKKVNIDLEELSIVFE